MQKIIIAVLCACLFIGCATGRNAVHDNGSGTDGVREHIGELGSQQAELAITGTELENRIERSTETVGELERTITDGTTDLERFAAILRRIRERGGADTIKP